jgi:hypothetical protein
MVRLARVLVLTGFALFFGNCVFAATAASCPSSVPSGITTCYYADYVNGSDTNSGTSESTPWKHLPGMQGCSNNCSTVTPGPGEGFILKGGTAWPAATLTWAWNWSGTGTTSNPGCTGSGCIYIGVDKTWYTGSSWARPILNAGGSSNPNTTILWVEGPGNYLIFDNLELTGLYWTGTPWYGLANVSLPAGTPGNGAHDTFENLYIHGWGHGNYASGTMEDPCGVIGDTADVNNNTDTILEYSVISGADTDQASCNGAVFGGPPYIAYNVMEYVGSCMVIDGPVSVHDNICQNTVASFEPTAHENGLEINDDGQNVTIYNNVIRHMGPGSLTFWIQNDPAHTAYIFNNVWYDTQPSNVIDLGSQSEYYNGKSGISLLWNNTIECGPDSNPSEVCANSIGSGVTAVTFQNNHFITNSGSYFSSNGPNPTTTTNLLQTKSAANGQGYTAAQTYAFSPTSSSSGTVGAGTSASSLCAASGVGTACQQSTTYGVAYNTTNHTVSTPGLTPKSVGSTNIGAYQFGVGPGAPQNLNGSAAPQ